MIDLDFEHFKKLSTQDIYNIISNAIDVADDDGILNSFVFQRALYVFAAAVLYTEKTDLIMTRIDQFPQLWDELVKDNTIDQLKNDYPNELNHLSAIGQTWFEEYNEHIHSSYAIVTAVSNIISNFTSNFKEQVDDISKSGDIAEVLKTAAKWGLDETTQA